jgi:hypothetical protein
VPLGSSVQGATSWLAKAGVRAVQMLRRALVLKHRPLAAASKIPRPWTDRGQRQREWAARACAMASVPHAEGSGPCQWRERTKRRARQGRGCAVLGLVAPSVAAWTPGSQQVADEGPWAASTRRAGGAGCNSSS